HENKNGSNPIRLRRRALRGQAGRETERGHRPRRRGRGGPERGGPARGVPERGEPEQGEPERGGPALGENQLVFSRPRRRDFAAWGWRRQRQTHDRGLVP